MHLRDGGHGYLLEPFDDPLHPAFVGNPIVAGCECRELPDVGASDEGVAGPAQHQDTQAHVGIDLLAGIGERVVHPARSSRSWPRAD